MSSRNAARKASRIVPSPHRRGARVAVAVGTAALLSLSAAPAMASTGGHASPDPHSHGAAGAFDSHLRFDNSTYTTLTVAIDGTATKVRWYKEVCYVANPQKMADTQSGIFGTSTIANPECGYQSMNIFVPESAFHDQSTAIYFGVNNAGWMSSYVGASVTDGASFDSATSNVGAALKAGYVYVDVGTRSRGLVAADSSYAGKAPDVVIDAKAAIRYLRLNDTRMPGSAERIVLNGTSGGGGLGAIVGASGNSTDYLPYLKAVGAAGVTKAGKSTLRDDVFAVNIYCPITDLGNADIAYEWEFTTLGTRAATADLGNDPSPTVSAELASRYASYLKSLHLKTADGRNLTADTMIAAIKKEVIRSAETYMKADAANTIPDLGEQITYTTGGFGQPPTEHTYTNDWIDVDNAKNRVVSLDMAKYFQFVATQATLKTVPAFDAWGLTGVDAGRTESTLFGTSAQQYSNYTAYSWDNNAVAGDGSGLDDTGLTWSQYAKRDGLAAEQVSLLDPLNYIDTKATTSANWYIRVGTRDRDTAFTVGLNLDRALAADRSVDDLNYRLAWNQPHAGNYDVPEAMAWIAKVLKDADGPSGHRH